MQETVKIIGVVPNGGTDAATGEKGTTAAGERFGRVAVDPGCPRVAGASSWGISVAAVSVQQNR